MVTCKKSEILSFFNVKTPKIYHFYKNFAAHGGKYVKLATSQTSNNKKNVDRFELNPSNKKKMWTARKVDPPTGFNKRPLILHSLPDISYVCAVGLDRSLAPAHSFGKTN